MQRTFRQVWVGSLFLCLYQYKIQSNTGPPVLWSPGRRWRWQLQRCCTLKWEKGSVFSTTLSSKLSHNGIHMFHHLCDELSLIDWLIDWLNLSEGIVKYHKKVNISFIILIYIYIFFRLFLAVPCYICVTKCILMYFYSFFSSRARKCLYYHEDNKNYYYYKILFLYTAKTCNRVKNP